MTKRCIHQEWNMGLDEAIEAEAQAQAICMQSKDLNARMRHSLQRQSRPFTAIDEDMQSVANTAAASAHRRAIRLWPQFDRCSPGRHGHGRRCDASDRFRAIDWWNGAR